MKRLIGAAVAAIIGAAVIGTAQPASASLIGDEIDIDWDFDNGVTQLGSNDFSVAVGAGIEGSCIGGGTGDFDLCDFINSHGFDIDIGDSSITFSWNFGDPSSFSSAAFGNRYIFSDLDWIGTGSGIVTGATVDTNLAGLDNSRLDYGDDWVSINVEGIGGLDQGKYFTINIEAEHDVPEPATLALLGLGLAGLGFARRRRQ